jgi:hypothetical protein
VNRRARAREGRRAFRDNADDALYDLADFEAMIELVLEGEAKGNDATANSPEAADAVG